MIYTDSMSNLLLIPLFVLLAFVDPLMAAIAIAAGIIGGIATRYVKRR